MGIERENVEPVWLIELTDDRPIKGMWHCGPNAAWVTVTHLPTMISARAYDSQHHKAKEAAFACCEMMVEQSRLDECQFPDRVGQRLDEQQYPERVAMIVPATPKDNSHD